MSTPRGTVTVNGEAEPWREGMMVLELVERLTTSTRGIAVAVERSVVPRSEWASTLIDDGATIEIVTAVAGG